MYFQITNSSIGNTYLPIRHMLNMKGLKPMAKEKIINVRVTSQQYEKIQNSADLRKMTISEYVRFMMTAGNTNQTLPALQRTLEIISDMSNDINHTCEILETDYPDLCNSLEERVSELCRTLSL